MKKTIKKLVAIFSICALLLSMAACTKTTSDTSGQKPTTTAPKESGEASKSGSATPHADLSGEVDALLWLSSYPEAIDQILKGFKEKYPNIKVNLQTMTGETTSENLEPRIQSNNMPDVCSVDITQWYYAKADQGYFKDLSGTKAWENQLDAIKKQWTSPKGTHYGVSYGVAGMFIYYNEDMFKSAGIETLPTNWDEFLAVCAKLKAADFTPLSWCGGFANMLGHTAISAGIANNVYLQEPSFSNDVLTTNYDFGTDAWANIFEKEVQLADLGYFNEGFRSTDYAESIRLFADEEVAMTFQGSWSAGDLFPLGEKVKLFIPPWNKAGDPIVGIMGGETGFGRGNTDNPAADAFFEYIAFENYAKFQNFTGTIPIYPAGIAEGVKIDKRLSDAMAQMKDSAPLAFQLLPDSTYNAMMQFAQDVLLGNKKPQDVGSVLNPIQKEYISGLK